MTPSTPPLSAQIATLRLAVPSGTATGNRGLHSYIIELICACLTRIFSRLEQMAQLWQDGALPIPAPRNPVRRESARQPRGRVARRSRYPRPRTPTQAGPDSDRAIPIAHPHPAPRNARHSTAGPRPPIRATHDPPPHGVSKNQESTAHQRVVVIPISK